VYFARVTPEPLITTVPEGESEALTTEAYTVTVAEGSLTLVKNSAYANQTTIAGKSAFKVGSYVLTSANEDITITQFTVGVTASAGSASDLSNMYLVYGDQQTTPKATVSTSNIFNVTYEMSAGTQLVIDVYADISSGATGNYTTTLAVSGTATVSGTAASADEVTGQTITIGTASVTASLDSGTPDPQLAVAATSDMLVAKFRWTASNADATVTEAYIKLVDPDAINTVVSAKLDLNNDGTPDTPEVYPVLTPYEAGTVTEGSDTITVDDATMYTAGDKLVVIYNNQAVAVREVDSASGQTITLTSNLPANVDGDETENEAGVAIGIGAYVFPFTGGSLSVPKDDYTTVGVYLTLNDVTTNGDSGDDVKVALVKHTWKVDGSSTTEYVADAEFTGIAANSTIVRRTVPTVSLADSSPSGALVAGAKTPVLYVDVAADSAYQVQVKSIKVTPVINNGGNTYVEGGDGIYVYDENGNLKGSALTQGTTGLSQDVSAATNIIQVGASEVSKYQVGERVTVTGNNVNTTTYITAVGAESITIATNVGGNEGDTVTTVTPAGYTAGYAYQITLTNFVVAAGDTKTLMVKADTTGLTDSGDYVRFDINADSSSGSTGNFVWSDGADSSDINGYLVESLPITGNTLITQ